jgi:hypothetical protein
MAVWGSGFQGQMARMFRPQPGRLPARSTDPLYLCFSSPVFKVKGAAKSLQDKE